MSLYYVRWIHKKLHVNRISNIRASNTNIQLYLPYIIMNESVIYYYIYYIGLYYGMYTLIKYLK
jgi:hypothetical protein